jgi:MFS family permease
MLRIESLSQEAISISLKFFSLSISTIALNMISSTFIFLYIIDEVGIVALGLILSISFVVSAVTDYPTGVLADLLGHKWVLSVAYVLFSISTILLIFADSVTDFIVTYIVLALANGQASGALQSWFDNNYKKYSQDEDPKREIYREFLGRASMFFQYTGSIVFLVGGIIASSLGGSEGRIVIFSIQAIGMMALAVVFVFVLDTTQEVKKEESTYIEMLKEGISYSFSSRMMTYYVIAAVIIIAISEVWYSLVLFVVYFGYTDSDAGAGVLRWLIWFVGAMITGKAGTISKKLTEKPWIPRLSFTFISIMFGFTALVVAIKPITVETASYNLFGALLIFLIIVVGGFFLEIYTFLTQKLFLEIVPDNLRNSIYSLLPTLGLLIGAILVFPIGSVIESSGLAVGIVIIILIAFVGVFFEFLALQLYEPPDEEIVKPEILYDVYSIANYDRVFHKFPKKWQFSVDVSIIWDRLMKVALQDGIVDNDEKELLDSIMINLKEYGKTLERALRDNIITEEEKIELLLARNKLIQEAEAVASKDAEITEVEAKIIDKLMKIVHQLHIDHHIENSFEKKDEIIE